MPETAFAVLPVHTVILRLSPTEWEHVTSHCVHVQAEQKSMSSCRKTRHQMCFDSAACVCAGPQLASLSQIHLDLHLKLRVLVRLHLSAEQNVFICSRVRSSCRDGTRKSLAVTSEMKLDH